jgi:hypothetical protein
VLLTFLSTFQAALGRFGPKGGQDDVAAVRGDQHRLPTAMVRLTAATSPKTTPVKYFFHVFDIPALLCYDRQKPAG